MSASTFPGKTPNSFSANVTISAISSSVRVEVTGFCMSTKTTAPVIVGAEVGMLELGKAEGVIVGTALGAAVTKFTQKIENLMKQKNWM